ncbi:MAG: SusD/RagB family nutrient-binding outer membrane lipoprotein [Ferruginibacter sp.]
MKSLKTIALSVALGATFLTGCDKIKDFGDTNVNPNATTTPNTAALLTNVLAGVAGRASSANPGYYCQYFAETQYPTVSLYSIPQFDFDGVYAGAMYDLQNIINNNTDPKTAANAAINGSTKNQIAIATILKSYYYWTITDAWGDIPYSQALTITNKFPKYDSQEEVYKGVIAELTAAVDQFDNGLKVKGDIAYNGNTAQWQKLANSVRMLMALRLSKKFPNAGQYAALQFNAALTHPAGFISDNADNFKIDYPGGNFQSPWFLQYNSRDDLGESLGFVNLLNGLGDRRQSDRRFGRSDNGVPYGRDRQSFMNAWFATNSTTYSKVLGDAYRAENASVAVVHAAAVFFARAEARERGWTTATETATADQLYYSGITASFTQWGLTAAQATTYAAGSGVIYGGTNLDKIALQRYIAYYPDGLQGWCEWRRTGVPTLTPAQDASNVTKAIPRRYVYGVNDYSTNRINVQAAADAIPLPVPTPAGAIAGDTQDGRVWWDR